MFARTLQTPLTEAFSTLLEEGEENLLELEYWSLIASSIARSY